MQSPANERWREALRDPSAYPHPVEGPVELRETHISRIYLAGRYAYKTKKACVTEFLDYGSLSARKAACEQELRLNRRYAPDLYLRVVPIRLVDGRFRVGAPAENAPADSAAKNAAAKDGSATPESSADPEVGEAVEYAVQMHRFPDDALLGERLRRGALTGEQVSQLAETVAAFHASAAIADPGLPWGTPARVRADAMANFHALRLARIDSILQPLVALEQWTEAVLRSEAPRLRQRIAEGWIRECHGDLHLANVIDWRGRWIPFDGIEFNDGFRWIDVLSDAAFLAMDFAARGHLPDSRRFTSDYFEHTGDHRALVLWRWYLVYRALVRAKVAAMRAEQQGVTGEERRAALEDCRAHVALAERFTAPEPRRLWITHGLSGSGKTTGSERVVQQRGAIRIRSDVERKRMTGIGPRERLDRRESERLYSDRARGRTYDRLHELASEILRSGYSVVVDATFLRRDQRGRFRELAEREGARFAILEFAADEATLRRRIAARMTSGRDASDAGIEVLEQQLISQEPLTDEERPFVVECPTPSN